MTSRAKKKKKFAVEINRRISIQFTQLNNNNNNKKSAIVCVSVCVSLRIIDFFPHNVFDNGPTVETKQTAQKCFIV